MIREVLIKKTGSPVIVITGILLLIIIIVAMKIPANQNKYTYLALGDSYTIGEKVTTEENFPNQVIQLLKQQGFEFKTPEIIATTGWTTDELQDGIDKANLKKRYDFVSLLIGVNNQYRGRKVEEYVPEFESLLKQAIAFAENKSDHVIVLSIPDWGVTPFAKERDTNKIAAEINEYNKANKAIADKYKVHYINVTESTREATHDSSLLAEDGLHPSGKEYKKWAEAVAEIIKTKL
jgi:lysophospholipase L1-like esterase